MPSRWLLCRAMFVPNQSGVIDQVWRSELDVVAVNENPSCKSWNTKTSQT